MVVNSFYQNQDNKFKVDFLFIDEIGISLDPNQLYFGVGGLEIGNTIDINRQLHDVFTGALSFLNQKEERFEFKFKYANRGSLRFYKQIINILKQTLDWNFDFILEKKELLWKGTVFWNNYLEYINLLIKKFPDKDLILVSDFLSKPKKEEVDLFNIIKNNPRVLNILQLESQGSLFLQVADILLGGIAYQKRIQEGFKTNDLKRELSNLVIGLLQNKKEQL